MPCYAPLHGWLSQARTATGKRAVVFRRQEGFVDRKVSVPCGQCIGCRLEYRHQWAMRCVHEASLHEENSFITLTYDDENLPEGGTLVKSHWQKFMKRLRRRNDGKRIRFYHSGEYGDINARPHYHAILFGFDFNDKRLHTVRNGNNVFTSQTLEEVWDKGFSEIGDCSYQSAGYVAGYVVKKLKTSDDDLRQKFYGGRLPEYATMSRNPGIGMEWYAQYKEEVLKHDSVIVDGREVKPPKYYGDKLAQEFPTRFAAVKGARKRAIDYDETTDVRLDTKRKVATARLEHFSSRVL